MKSGVEYLVQHPGWRSKRSKRQKQYRLRWEIDIYATSPEAAAKEAREVQLDFESEATFDVRVVRGNKVLAKVQRITVRDKVGKG